MTRTRPHPRPGEGAFSRCCADKLAGGRLRCLPWPFTDASDTPAVAAAHAASVGAVNANTETAKGSTLRHAAEPRPASRSQTAHQNPETTNPHTEADTLVRWQGLPQTKAHAT